MNDKRLNLKTKEDIEEKEKETKKAPIRNSFMLPGLGEQPKVWVSAFYSDCEQFILPFPLFSSKTIGLALIFISTLASLLSR